MTTNLFRNRPCLATVAAACILLSGVLSLTRSRFSDYPEIAPPVVSVSTTYAGADPQVVANTVAAPIEVEVNGVDNVDHFESSCNDTGAYSLYVTFKAGSDPDMNLVNVQNAVKRAEPRLPGEVVQLGVNVMKAPSDYMIRFAFTADGTGISQTELGSYVNKEIKESLQRVEGVSHVAASERGECAMRVWLDPRRMDALGLSVTEVKTAIAQQNIQSAAGFVGNAFSSQALAYKINVRGRLSTEREFEDIVVRSDPATGARVRLGDVARCELGSKSYASQPRFGDRLAFFLSVYRDPAANTMETASKCKQVVADWMARLPAGAEYAVSMDNTLFTRELLDGLVRGTTAGLGAALAVVFLLSGGWRVAFLAAVAAATALAGALTFVDMSGWSLNAFTVSAMACAVGYAAGGAVLAAYDARHAGRQGAGMAAIATSSCAAVAFYSPILVSDGMVGMMHIRFAATLMAAVVASAATAYMVLPALSARLRLAEDARESGLSPRMADAMAGVAVRHPRFVAAAVLALSAAGLWTIRMLPSAFMPEEDRGFLKIEAELSEGSSIERTNEVVEKAHDLLENTPGVEMVSSAAASSHVGKIGENHAELNVLLAPWKERSKKGLSGRAVAAEMERRLAEISTAEFTVIHPPAINGLGNYGGVAVYLCALGEYDPARHAADAEAYAERLAALPQVRGVATTFSAETPHLRLHVDRDKAHALGVPAATIFSTMQNELASFYVNDFNLRGGAYQVVVQNDLQTRSGVADVRDIHLPGKDGKMVPLSAVGRLDYALGPRVVPRFNKLPAAGIVVTPSEGASPLEIVDWIEKNPPDPARYVLEWSTMTEQERSSRGRLGRLAALATLLAALVLVVRYESWLLPLAVLAPSAMSVAGAAAAAWLLGEPLSIYAQLGMLVAAEWPVLQAVFAVECAEAARRHGTCAADAIRNATASGLHTSLVPTLAFMAAVGAFACGGGVGAAARRAMALPILSGLAAALFSGPFAVCAAYVLARRGRACG